MVIDTHGHITAPAGLYAYKADLIASRGFHGRKPPAFSDDQLRVALSGRQHVESLAEVGTDVQLISARPYHLMHSESPASIVQWWVEANNDVVARHCELYPELFRGVASLPQQPGVGIESTFAELERCVEELGFVGCLVNPDPAEGTGYVPPLGDEYWYPLWERLVDLDVPALLHSAGCNNGRESYSNHFITEESIGILSLLGSDTLDRFPTLKLIFPHGGGSVPYQAGRWRAQAIKRGGFADDFDRRLRTLHFDSVLYSAESLDLLIRTVGPDRVLFATEKPGSGTAFDEKEGRWMDDVKVLIDRIPWLSDEDRTAIYRTNATSVYTRLKV